MVTACTALTAFTSWPVQIAPAVAAAGAGGQLGAEAGATLPGAQAMLLVDADTGRQLYGEHEHTPLPPASLTKMLTALIAADWLTPSDDILVSARAAGVAPDKVGMKAGQQWPLTLALHALLISSANDAAYALAEHISGTVERFAQVMRQAANQLGMSDGPTFHDPAGLDGSQGVDGGNLVSAWDLAIAARALMANSTLASIVPLKTFRFTGPDGIVYELSSHNLAFLNSYPGAIGVKTGFTDPAGVCVAEEATRAGRTMLAVVMHGVSPDQTAEMLLDKGFATPVASEPSTASVLPPVVEPEQPAPRRLTSMVPSEPGTHLAAAPAGRAASGVASVALPGARRRWPSSP